MLIFLDNHFVAGLANLLLLHRIFFVMLIYSPVLFQ
jgi:hypothetical protein